MSRKILKPTNLLFSKIWLIIITAVLIMLVACQSKTNTIKKETPVAYWISLNIKFKPTATEGIRDTCLMQIKKMLIDTVQAIRKQYPDYYPSVSEESFPFSDATVYSFKITKGTKLHKPVGVPGNPHDTSTNYPISCTCASGCKICNNFYKARYGFNPASAKNLSDYIESVSTN